MNFLYTREENESEVVITYRRYALYYWSSLVLVLAFFLSGWLNDILQLVFIVLLLIVSISQIIMMWKPSKEVRTAMKRGNVEITGSKLSLKNPLKIKIKK